MDDSQNFPSRPHRWRRWFKPFVQPLLLLAAGALLFVGLGVAQRCGWISAGRGNPPSEAGGESRSARYICPMMCTPPQAEPGRCPVCAMELVPTDSDVGGSDGRSVQIDPAARRVAHIQTVAVRSMPLSRTVRAVGELGYDEGSLRTISAYVDGRLERLDANYTGVVVEEGDSLALVYSPRLYSGQVELLSARRARNENRSTSLGRLTGTSADLYHSARQRLIEFGMTDRQIDELERNKEADSRMTLCAPMSGTVIEKCAVEGEYVKEGQPILKLADLSTVWLQLKLFPEDAAAVRNGQPVEAEVQSLPDRTFSGRVMFVAPVVDRKTRTVDVRVEIPNPDGLLRVGDYAKATIPISPATSDEPAEDGLVVPRDAVLSVGRHSVLYVETEPGRFEMRSVTLGTSCGDRVVILDGVSEGEQVAVRGNFLIDSQMQLAGNPSLIDPSEAAPSATEGMTVDMDLPPIGPLEPMEPFTSVPPMEAPQPIQEAERREEVVR